VQVVSASPSLQQQQQPDAGKEQTSKATEGAAQPQHQNGEASKEKQQGAVENSAPGFVENVNKYLLGPAPPRAVQAS